MRYRRALWFRKIRKHKWRLMAAAVFLVVTINVVYKKINFIPPYNVAHCEEIDVVYTWVNGSDPAFINSMKEYNPNYDPARFDDKNELKFSLRSLEKFAPWVRHIYIVTNGQIPKWLDLTNARVTIVPHEVLAPNSQLLPTFSSAAIETFIHRIPNLSKRFIYLNDDIFLGAQLYPEDLFTDSEGVKIFQAWMVPDCAEDCPWTYIGDGACDRHCNIEACQYDGGDCSDKLGIDRNNNSRDKFSEPNKAVKKDLSKDGPKKFPNRIQLLQSRHSSNKNLSFKNILMRQKNLSSTIDLEMVVNDFNKKLQAQLQPEKDPKNYATIIENNSFVPSKDIYSQSLIYTNMLLNRHYGFKARNVLGHVGFLLEKSIIEDMQQKFSEEIALTSKHRFRATNDIQFAFAYYSFLMEETRRASVREIFNEFDTDHSLTWSDREIRTFLAKTFQLPLDWSAVRFFEDVVQNCSLIHTSDKQFHHTTILYERYENSYLVYLKLLLCLCFCKKM